VGERAAPALIRPFEHADAPGVRAVNVESFPSTAEADVVETMRDSDAERVELVATAAGGDVIGHILISAGDVDGRAPVWCLGPMAVAAAHRRRGVGGALVEAACDAACVIERRPIFLLGDPAYYGRFGFDAAYPLGFTSCFVGGEVPEEAFMVRSPEGTPPARGAVNYRREFARFL